MTSLQLSRALMLAGFVDIEGEVALDPVVTVGASWGGIQYAPITLNQGTETIDFSTEIDALECDIGVLGVPKDLPSTARSQLAEVAGCQVG
ncbi:MAG: hypothetical protein HKN03_01545 [Acidimicrobiales bacterium]|nr:hypothetical protein [Acidimicrobiales bacterium]